jgi:hypothetical protein
VLIFSTKTRIGRTGSLLGNVSWIIGRMAYHVLSYHNHPSHFTAMSSEIHVTKDYTSFLIDMSIALRKYPNIAPLSPLYG